MGKCVFDTLISAHISGLKSGVQLFIVVRCVGISAEDKNRKVDVTNKVKTSNALEF